MTMIVERERATARFDCASRTFDTMAVAALIAASTVTGMACAQERYPAKPVRLIVPLAPGGSTDIVARLVAQKLGDGLRQTVLVDNRPGAGTSLGSNLVAKASPDGYTLLFTSVSLATNAVLYPKLPFDTLKDFAPIGTVGQSFYVLIVQPSLGVRTVPELIALAKSKPGQIQYASAGPGTITHLTVELFSMNAGIKMQDVPFKGGAPALIAFLGGQMPVIFSPIAECLPHLRSGAKVRPLAVTAAKRMPDLPDVPTLAEVGVPNSEVEGRSAMYAPARTPRQIVAQLNPQAARYA
jgi:tripartite-type tricarboxylate transporter receptor subunit TctC